MNLRGRSSFWVYNVFNQRCDEDLHIPGEHAASKRLSRKPVTPTPPRSFCLCPAPPLSPYLLPPLRPPTASPPPFRPRSPDPRRPPSPPLRPTDTSRPLPCPSAARVLYTLPLPSPPSQAAPPPCHHFMGKSAPITFFSRPHRARSRRHLGDPFFGPFVDGLPFRHLDMPLHLERLLGVEVRGARVEPPPPVQSAGLLSRGERGGGGEETRVNKLQEEDGRGDPTPNFSTARVWTPTFAPVLCPPPLPPSFPKSRPP